MSGQPGEDVAKVLVVDDEEVIREILADFLTMEGFYVRTAEDGAPHWSNSRATDSTWC